jgi:hypothetical protein
MRRSLIRTASTGLEAAASPFASKPNSSGLRVALAFQNGEFGGFDGDLFPGRLACHDATASERPPHEPMMGCQCALNHVSSLGSRQLCHLVNERELGQRQGGAPRHAPISSSSVFILLRSLQDGTHIGECEAVFPKDIKLEVIARMNRDFLRAIG